MMFSEGEHQDENYEAVDDIDLRETDHLEVEDAESDMSPPNSQSPKTKGKLKVGKKNPRAPKGHDKSPVRRKKGWLNLMFAVCVLLESLMHICKRFRRFRFT